jgi:hypothetical protein
MRGRAAASLVALAAVLGCADEGPKRHRVSGRAAFKGEPIPYGDVLITPDGAKKNAGAQGIAAIRDGVYDTARDGGKGYGGGPAVVRVTGLTGPGGKLLCEWEFQADLPPGDATHDIDLPAKAGAKAKPGPDI